MCNQKTESFTIFDDRTYVGVWLVEWWWWNEFGQADRPIALIQARLVFISNTHYIAQCVGRTNANKISRLHSPLFVLRSANYLIKRLRPTVAIREPFSCTVPRWDTTPLEAYLHGSHGSNDVRYYFLNALNDCADQMKLFKMSGANPHSGKAGSCVTSGDNIVLQYRHRVEKLELYIIVGGVSTTSSSRASCNWCPWL